MTEKVIERYAVTNLVDAYWPDPSGSWMRYDAELVRDALRYRWLREPTNYPDHDWWANELAMTDTAEQFDTAIDTAISHSGREQG